jgi:hypothetical protein
MPGGLDLTLLEQKLQYRRRLTAFIHERCTRFIECLPSLQHDPNRPEDVLKVDADEDGVGGDDAADCLRYLVATKTRSVLTRKLMGAVINNQGERRGQLPLTSDLCLS